MNARFQPQHHPGSELFRDRPQDDECYLEFVAGDGFACFLRTDVLVEMSAAGVGIQDEIMGRLGGRHCRDTKGTYVLVEGATLCRAARGSAAFIHADNEAQKELRRDFECECRAYDSIGWWHTHPGSLALTYSCTDRANQRTWNQPDAIGIVLRPGLGGTGLSIYRGPESEKLTLASLNVLRQLQRNHAQLLATRSTAATVPEAHASTRSIQPPTTRSREFTMTTRQSLSDWLAAAAFGLAAATLAFTLFLSSGHRPPVVPPAPVVVQPPATPAIEDLNVTVYVTIPPDESDTPVICSTTGTVPIEGPPNKPVETQPAPCASVE